MRSGNGPARVRWAAIAIAATLWVPGRTDAIELERLVMPGELARSHADLESDCGSCHSPFNRTEQDALCIKCHDAVAGDVEGAKGFHGRFPGVAHAECQSCHTDHKGRDADILGLSPETFDHSFTDFGLVGAHARTDCASCHAADAKHRDAPGDCIDCHREDDPHGGKLGDDCGRCHEPDGWKKTEFDHDKTRFPLVGQHRDVACGLCHVGQRYEGTASDCNSCHRVDDAHRGRYGTDCQTCHTPRAWKPSVFDHARETGFALDGAHAEASCRSCHPGRLYEDKVSPDCVACHRSDDVHRGRRGTDCGNCHQTRAWTPARFDHDSQTSFPLRGAHREASCEGCHIGNIHDAPIGSGCNDCHEGDDVHHGQLGRDCNRCHGETAWATDVFFDHDLSRFPLLGLHAVAACEQCHTTSRFRDAAVTCVSCHEDDDVHLARLGPRCETCHNPNAWRIWRFDHDAETSFPLRGAHVKLDCISCHRTPVSGAIELASSCDGCHTRDDVHSGAFGRDCGRCHTEMEWRDVKILQR